MTLTGFFSQRPIFTWNPAGGIPDFIKTLYQNILGRDPLPEVHSEINYWKNHTLFHGIASTISGFFTSDEFKAKNFLFSQEVVVDNSIVLFLDAKADGMGKIIGLTGSDTVTRFKRLLAIA